MLILKSPGRLPGVLRARAEEHDSGAREAVLDVAGAGMLAAVPGHHVVPSRQLPPLHQPVRRLRGTATAPLPRRLHHWDRQRLQDEDVSVNDGRCVGFNPFTAPACTTYGRCVGFNPFTAPAFTTYGRCVDFNPFTAPACTTIRIPKLSSHTPSIAFRHLPLNSARFSYATEGALFISAQLSSDAVSALRQVRVLIIMTVEAT